MNKYLIISILSFNTMGAWADELTEGSGFTYEFGGKLRLGADQFDELYANNGDSQRERYLRRLDLEVSGQLVKNLNYEVEYKLNYEGKVELKTAQLEWLLPYNFSLVLGRYDPDFGLELSGSSAWVTGVARSSIWDLAPYAGEGASAQGLSLRQWQKHHFISLGYFDTEEGPLADFRFVYAPIQKKKQVLHLGYSFSELLEAESDGEIKTDLSVYSLKFSNNGNSTKLAKTVSTGVFDKDFVQTLEFAYLLGPVSLQAEYLQRDMRSTEVNRQAKGGYLQLAYTLTGESRDYNISDAKFGRIKPKASYGAWEVFYRHDQLETLGEAGILSQQRNKGSAEVDVLGLNWYAREDLKLSFNLLRADTSSIDNDVGDVRGDAYSLQIQYKF